MANIQTSKIRTPRQAVIFLAKGSSILRDHSAKFASAKEMNMEMGNFLAPIVSNIGENAISAAIAIRR